MSNLSRRAFVAQSAALLPLSRISLLNAKPVKTLTNVGVELYTVREVVTKDPATILNSIQEIGYTEVEAVYATLEKIWPALQQTKLKPVSVHVDTGIFTDKDPARLDTVLQDVKTRGFSYVVFPYLPPSDRGGMDVYKKLAGVLNKAGERAKAHDLTFCYHNHAFEFEPMNGTMPIDALIGETDKGLVNLEMDMFWVSVAGHDPIEILKKYGARIPLLHLKDKAAGFPVQFNENVPKSAFKEVGNGSLNVAAILSAAAKTGVKHYFVEQDQTPGDPLDSLRQSYKYLGQYIKA